MHPKKLIKLFQESQSNFYFTKQIPSYKNPRINYITLIKIAFEITFQIYRLNIFH